MIPGNCSEREQHWEDRACVLMRSTERKSGSFIQTSPWNIPFFVLLTSSVEVLSIPHSSAVGEAGTIPVGAAGAQVAILLLSWPFPHFPSLPFCFYGILQLPQSICQGEQWLLLCGEERENKEWMAFANPFLGISSPRRLQESGHSQPAGSH